MSGAYARALMGKLVKEALAEHDERKCGPALAAKLELAHLMDRPVSKLSGGELQRLACAITMVRDVDVYIFDEPSSFLDLKQRLIMSEVIRNLLEEKDHKCYVMVVEHDLAVLSMVSDGICCLYGNPGAYGIVSQRMGTRPGINQFLQGYLSGANTRFRETPLTFWAAVSNDGQPAEPDPAAATAADSGGGGGAADASAKGGGKKGEKFEKVEKEFRHRAYDSMMIARRSPVKADATPEEIEAAKKPSFKLEVKGGKYAQNGQVVVLLGENGTGKSTFIVLLSRWLVTGMTPQEAMMRVKKGVDADGEPLTEEQLEQAKEEVTKFTADARSVTGLVSIKRQHPLEAARRKFRGTVRRFLDLSPAAEFVHDRSFKLLVLNPLRVEELLDLPVQSLSGGELQRLAVVVCLGTPAHIYLLDEPSAALDCEQRVNVAKVIKRWVVSHRQKTAFVVEHDFAMASILADRVIVFSGQPGVSCVANAPCSVESGFNTILQGLGATMRLDQENGRPCINKKGSAQDKEQKKAGQYYLFNPDQLPEPGHDPDYDPKDRSKGKGKAGGGGGK